MIDVEHDKRKINDDGCRLNKNEKEINDDRLM